MSDCKLPENTIRSQTAGKVMVAFLSIAPAITLVSLVAFITAVLAFHFFFNPNIRVDTLGAFILGGSLILGLCTLFRSVHLYVEGKLFKVLYENTDETEQFDMAVQFLWKKHKNNLNLQERWLGSRRNFMRTITLCLAQWLLTIIGFVLLVLGF